MIGEALRLYFFPSSTDERFDFSEWMTLRDAYLHATEVLGSSETADAAVRYSLEMCDTCALCEQMICSAADAVPATLYKWVFLTWDFWPDAKMDWDKNCAAADLPLGTFFTSGLWIPRDDVFGLWRTSSASSAPAVSEAALTAYLIKNADGNTSELKLRKSADDHFSSNKITARRWRDAFAKVPKAKKLLGRPKTKKSDN
jgi:hypothetical protein